MSETLATYGTPPAGHGRTIEPLRCPRCGELPMIESWFCGAPPRHSASCNCAGSGVTGHTHAAAVNKWNHRIKTGFVAPAEPQCAAPPRAIVPLVTTIRWHRPAERLPADGQTVVVWIQALGIVQRACRDARLDGEWRSTGAYGCTILTCLVTAWTELPDGTFPFPDNGGNMP